MTIENKNDEMEIIIEKLQKENEQLRTEVNRQKEENEELKGQYAEYVKLTCNEVA